MHRFRERACTTPPPRCLIAAALILLCLHWPHALAAEAVPSDSVASLSAAVASLHQRIASSGLSGTNIAAANALIKRLETAGSGYFPGANELSSAVATSKPADALAALTWIENSLAAAGKRAPGEASIDRQADHDALKAILASRDYKLKLPDWSWTAIIQAKILQFIRDLFDAMSRSGKGIVTASRVFLMTILFLIFAAAIFAAFWYYFQYRDRRRVLDFEGEPLDGFAIDSPDTHRKRALEFIEHGEYRLAMRQIFLVLLSQLERMKLVTYDRSRTNLEYAVEFARRARNDEASSHMRAIVRAYDRKWYGGDACTDVDVSDFDSKVTAFVERAMQSPGQTQKGSSS